MTDRISALIADGPGKGRWLAMKDKTDVPYCVEVVHDEWISKPYSLHAYTILGKMFWVAALDIANVSTRDILRMIFDGRDSKMSVENDRLCVYHASYYSAGGYGSYQEAEYIICANTEAEALGFALEADPGTEARYWTISKIDTSRAGSTEILNRSN